MATSSPACERIDDELTAELAAELVVGADKGGLVGEAGDVGVDQDDGDAGRDGLLEGRLDLIGLRRRHGDRIDLGGDLQLDDADLAFDVGFFVGAEEGSRDRGIGLHGRFDAGADRLPVVAGHGLDDDGDVQRLDFTTADGRLAGSQELVDVVLGDDFDAGVDEGLDGLAAGDLGRREGAELADLGGELRDRAAERAVGDSLECIR